MTMNRREYAVDYFASSVNAEKWLNEKAAEGFRLVSSSTCLAGGDDNEGNVSQIWLVMEREEKGNEQ